MDTSLAEMIEFIKSLNDGYDHLVHIKDRIDERLDILYIVIGNECSNGERKWLKSIFTNESNSAEIIIRFKHKSDAVLFKLMS